MEDSGTFATVVGEDGGIRTLRVIDGQLFVCEGSCCGNVERGSPAVPLKRFKQEWKARGLENRVHLTVSGCLGPCLASVVLFVYRGESVWFHSVNLESDVVQIFDYIQRVVDQCRLESPSYPLAQKVFRRFISDATGLLAEDAAA